MMQIAAGLSALTLAVGLVLLVTGGLYYALSAGRSSFLVSQPERP